METSAASTSLHPIYPLQDVVVVDISRLAITLVSRLLTDMGATTIAVHPPAMDRLTTPYAGGGEGGPVDGPAIEKLNITLNLKDSADRETLYGLVQHADVFIEGYRPGVAARLGCSYEDIRAVNPEVIYCSVTGYGQTGPRAHDPGHDINYISVAGAQSLVRTTSGEYALPLNIIADMAGCGLYGAMTVCAALAHRNGGGGGSYLDISMTDGVATLIAGILDGAQAGLPDGDSAAWPRNRHNARGGRGMLGGGAPFYRIYACSDGLPLSVGCIEPQFWAALCRVTGLESLLPHQLDESRWPEMSLTFERIFASKSRPEWLAAFEGADTCVTPVLTAAEARAEPQLQRRKRDGIYGGGRVQSPMASARPGPRAVLAARGYSQQSTDRLEPRD